MDGNGLVLVVRKGIFLYKGGEGGVDSDEDSFASCSASAEEERAWKGGREILEKVREGSDDFLEASKGCVLVEHEEGNGV